MHYRLEMRIIGLDTRLSPLLQFTTGRYTRDSERTIAVDLQNVPHIDSSQYGSALQPALQTL